MKKKVWTAVCAACLSVLVISEIILGAKLAGLGMIPDKYLWLALTAALVVTGLIGWCAFPRVGKYEKASHTVRRVIACILALVLSLGCIFGATAVHKVDETMNAVSNNTVVSSLIGIYVRTDDPAKALQDTSDYRFGVTKAYDWDNTQKALSALGEKLGKPVTTEMFLSVTDMVDALYNGQVDALILNSAYLGILEEMPDYADFGEKARLLYAHLIETVIQESPAPQPTWATDPDGETVPVKPTPRQGFLLYLSGSDTRSHTLSTSRSDVNILAAVNPVTKQILLVSTPRDTYIANPAGNGALDKLTHCGIYGLDCSVGALEGFFGLDIDDSAQINFTGFKTLVDAVGGVQIYSDVELDFGTFVLVKGMNDLNGDQALGYVRNRKSFAGGDRDRGKHQMQVLKAVLQKLTSGTTLLTNYAEILDSMKGMFVTSMTREEIGDFVKLQLEDMAQWEIFSYSVNGTGSSNTTYSMPDFMAYVMIPNMATVEKASDLMYRVLYGDTISNEDLK